jgi:hypothetical protein
LSSAAIILVGVVTGFATAVWTTLSVSTYRHHRPWIAFLQMVLGAANLTTTAILFNRLGGTPLTIPPFVNTALLVALIGLPAVLAFLPWLTTQTLLRRKP